MHRLAWTLAALAALAAPAAAGTMLYATAATPGRINGFCVGPNGALAREPRVTVETVGLQPSRLVVSRATRTLYVAENDRIEIFRIGDDGSLTRPQPPAPNHLPKPVEKGINSHDILLDCPEDDAGCVPTVLYVPERRAFRLVTFPLGPDGIPVSQVFDSCARGTADTGFEYLVRHPTVSPPIVYASQTFESNDSGAVAIYELDPAGRFVGDCVVDADPANGDDPGNCNKGETAVDADDDGEFENDANGDGICDDDTTTSADDLSTVIRCVSPLACGIAPPGDPSACPTLGAPVTCPRNWVPCPDDAGGPCQCCTAAGVATGLRTGQPGTEPVELPAGTAAERRRLPGAGAMLLQANPAGTVVSECKGVPSPFRLFIESRFAKRLQIFNLDENGNFDVLRNKDSCQAVIKSGGEVPRQRAAAKSQARIRYQDLALAGTDDTALIATQFIDGRVDAYGLRADGRFSNKGQPQRTTRKNVRTSPVRMAVYPVQDGRQVLYVAAGQLDRVEAYRLKANGVPATKDPFSTTNEIPGSFPNDVVLVTDLAVCD